MLYTKNIKVIFTAQKKINTNLTLRTINKISNLTLKQQITIFNYNHYENKKQIYQAYNTKAMFFSCFIFSPSLFNGSE